MGAYIIRRLLIAVIILILVSLIVFFSVRLLPGDPIYIFLGQQAQQGEITQEQLDRMRHDYGLDLPLMVQYFRWFGNILKGDFGESMNYREEVSTLFADRLPITLHLGILALIINVIVGTLMGLAAAIRRGTWIDSVSTTLANIGVCIPVFWLGYLLMFAFGLNLGWLEIAGYTSPFEDFWLNLRQIIMPVFAMSVTGLATTARIMRSSMLEVTRQDYIRTAWSKGLRERTVIMKHALKNGLIPVVTLLGMGIGVIFAGSVLVETVFAIPGMGRLLVTSIFAQDYIVMQSSALIIASIILISNLLVDISYGWLDPRIRYG
ncbi:MAG: peptide ABC transporter [Chloroflexi bacterium RBG_16_56_11]|nr:MAG: peptide ABC transporter [Chloroflexi bacterium RBG_16_56_11]